MKLYIWEENNPENPCKCLSLIYLEIHGNPESCQIYIDYFVCTNFDQ